MRIEYSLRPANDFSDYLLNCWTDHPLPTREKNHLSRSVGGDRGCSSDRSIAFYPCHVDRCDTCNA